MLRKIDRRTFLALSGAAAASGVVGLTFRRSVLAQGVPVPEAPDYILNPVEMSGADAVPIIGRLPGAERMYVLPSSAGEFHLIGTQVMTRAARPIDTGNVYELMMFTGRTGASMPRHLHRTSHAAFLVLDGEVELELEGRKWRMLRGDFANIPPGTPHAWTLRSDRSKIALYTMNDRVGAAFVAMGVSHTSADVPVGAQAAIDPNRIAEAASLGDFMRVPGPDVAGDAVRVTNKILPASAGAYVLLDGGGERYGGNIFLARNANTTGNFLFIMTEGGPSGGVPAHFHARHFENFLGVDGETLGWAYGKAVSLKAGDYFQAPPRNLHGFKLTQPYNRFAAFLTPGIFEGFFTRGGGQPPAGAGGGAAARPGGQPPAAGAGGAPAGGARGGAPGAGGGDMFRSLANSGRGPDGYPLDVHGPKLPLPPQDPVWLQGAARDSLEQRALLLMHAQMNCGMSPTRSFSPELLQALAHKPRAEDFV